MIDKKRVLPFWDYSEWRGGRGIGIGSSTAAAALGADPHHSPYALWCELRELVEREDISGKDAVRAGNYFEDGIRQWAADDSGREIITPGEWHRRVVGVTAKGPPKWVTFLHAKYPWMRATPDSFVIGVEGKPGTGVCEIKNHGAFMVNDWSRQEITLDDKYAADAPEDVTEYLEGRTPLRTMVQVQFQLACSEFRWGMAAAAIGGSKVVLVDIERDDEFIANMERYLVRFVQSVEDGTEPPVDGTESTYRALMARYNKKDPGRKVEVDADDVVEYQLASAAAKEADARKSAVRNKIAARIGAGGVGTVRGKPVCSYKSQRAGLRINKGGKALLAEREENDE